MTPQRNHLRLMAGLLSIFCLLGAEGPLWAAPQLACSAIFVKTAVRQAGEQNKDSGIDRNWLDAVNVFKAPSAEGALGKLAKALNAKASLRKLYHQTYASFDLQVVDGKDSSLVPKYDPSRPEQGIVLQARIGRDLVTNPFEVSRFVNRLMRTGAADPWTVFRYFGEQNGYHHGYFGSFYDWAETSANAAQGDRASQLELALFELDGQLNVFEMALSGRSPVLGALDEVVVKKAQEDFKQATLQKIRDLKTELDQVNRARKEKLVNFAAPSTNLEQLKNLVANNDRKGAAALISSALPWSIFSPSETRFWNSWLQSVSNPSGNKVLVYRGFDGDSEPKNQNGVFFGLARVFPRDGAVTTDVIKNTYADLTLALDPSKYDSAHLLPDNERQAINDMPPHLTEYMEGGFKKFSYNFSYDPWLSWTFAVSGNHESMGAFLIDENRLMLNLVSEYTPEGGGDTVEREIHSPLLIFPDEVVVYEEGLLTNQRTAFANFEAQFARKSGQPIVPKQQRDPAIVQAAIARFARLLNLSAP